MPGPRIIFLDEDNDYRLKLCEYLRSNGFRVTESKILSDAFGEKHNHEWTILLVNFGNNTNHGLEFLKASARRRQGPVLVLSDGDDPIDRIVCLELGAEDCIAKSTHQREILARIRVAARRRPPVPLVPAAGEPIVIPIERAAPEMLSAAWRFSRERRELIAPAGKAIDLTADQFGLLDILIQHTGKALSRDFLSRTLFGRALKAGDRSIDNLVVRLRRRLGEPARVPRLIKTARADGYFFAGFPEDPGIKAAPLPN